MDIIDRGKGMLFAEKAPTLRQQKLNIIIFFHHCLNKKYWNSSKQCEIALRQ